MSNNTKSTLNIIAGNKDFIVLEKPVGVSSQKDPSSGKSLDQMVKHQLKETPFVVQRLDKPVGGVIVYALNKICAQDISEQIQNKTVVKKYLAVVSGHVKADHGTLTHYLKKMKTLNMSKVVDETESGAKKAELDYNIIEHITDPVEGKLTLIEVTLRTGRHHQIRLQFSAIKHPIWGDLKYQRRFKTKQEDPQVALYSKSIRFVDMNGKERIFKCVPKDIFPFSLFKSL